MRCGVALALVTALAAQPPAASRLILELRVFDGTEEVTREVRVAVHRAGERTDPLTVPPSPDGRVELQVPAGLYDIQTIHEREGRVLDIRWANRLSVMAYPDEHGHHLEVINCKSGFGALEVRRASGTHPDVELYEAGKHETPVVAALATPTYSLFVVPAGRYDLLAHGTGSAGWQNAVEVPLDRTRLWIVR